MRPLSRVVAVATLFSFQFNEVCAQTQDTVRTLDEVLIKDSRASERSPFTTSNLTREQLDDAKSEVSIPFMLELQPSVVVSGENGKMGETTMRIRGVDASRINVNINGITLNDPESQAVFWYNVPNLGGMAQSLQVQRGVGASNGGGNSFGGAINLQTLNARDRAYAEADLSLGSWNTRQYGFAAGTGIKPSGLAFDVAYNGQTTDGYVRNGFADQQSLFVSGSYYGKRSLLKAVAIIGTQHTGITWNGEDASVLDENPTYNSAGEYYDALGNVYYYGNESDNYNQRRYQLYYSLLMNDRWSLKAVADFTHGDGYYEQYKADKKFSKYGIGRSGKSDFITQKLMWNSAYTANVSANYTGRRVNFTFGEMMLYFDGDHYGNVIWCKDSTGFDTKPYEWYRYKGNKVDEYPIGEHILRAGYSWLSEDLEDMKFHTHKVQCVLPNPVLEQELLSELRVVRTSKSGALMTIVARGTGDEIMEAVNRRSPVYAELLPLSLEEIFISETEVAGYDIQDIFA